MVTDNTMSLEQAEEILHELMLDVTKIWGQLNSDGFKKNFKGQGEYQNWRARAVTAYEAKSTDLKTLRDYMKGKWGVQYHSLAEIEMVIKERNLQAPDWMQNGNETSAQTQNIPVIMIDASQYPDEPVEEIKLSLQSQAQYNEILVRLKAARKEAGFNQEEIMAHFGYHGTTLGHWENGKTPVSLLNIFKLATLYNCDPLYILTGENGIEREALKEVAEYLGVAQSTLASLLSKKE